MSGIRNLDLGVSGGCLTGQVTSPLLVINAVGRKDIITPVCEDKLKAHGVCDLVCDLMQAVLALPCGSELPAQGMRSPCKGCSILWSLLTLHELS